MEHFFMQNNYGEGGKNAWDWLDDAVINSRGFIQVRLPELHKSFFFLVRGGSGGSSSSSSL